MVELQDNAGVAFAELLNIKKDMGPADLFAKSQTFFTNMSTVEILPNINHIPSGLRNLTSGIRNQKILMP